MIRNLKAMGLAMFALLALGAIGAQSASAVVDHSFTSTADPTVVTGTTEAGQKETFKLTAASVSCEDVRYRGTMVGKSADHVTVFPDFSGAGTTCSAGALGVATITNNGCTYTFDSETNENLTHFSTGTEEEKTHANVSVVCGHTGSITIAAGGCTITVKDTHAGNVSVNQGLPGIRYHEIDEEVTTTTPTHEIHKVKAITVTATVKTIKATTSGANCVLVGLGNPGTHSNGTYDGKATVTCYEDKGGTGHGPFTEGTPVNCGISTP